MAIQYKKIIKEIIGPEAKEHGFTLVKNGPAGMTKRNLAVYEKSIDEYAAIMHEKGYKAFLEDENEPRFHSTEHGYLLKKYKELSAEYSRAHNIDPDLTLIDKLNLIVKKVVELRGANFEDIKGELIKIAAFYTTSLLECEGTSIEEYRGYDFYVTLRGEMGALNVLFTILDLWKNGKSNVFIYNSCDLALSEDEFEALNLKL
ncbi:hypothetical protein D6853_02880 [Butyrivibrio sp. X503]|uniref:hypothetical protein n=1 Tax=Butyrivibrio sp. X503 TaxID=2364878 RepID=UPI000EAA3DF6|nr:hypothetical protein [Butyrivibrio sp. X503]RKM56981.1 hypothetical protein D6853_02880 [Butyrivibrio sp. X503]